MPRNVGPSSHPHGRPDDRPKIEYLSGPGGHRAPSSGSRRTLLLVAAVALAVGAGSAGTVIALSGADAPARPVSTGTDLPPAGGAAAGAGASAGEDPVTGTDAADEAADPADDPAAAGTDAEIVETDAGARGSGGSKGSGGSRGAAGTTGRGGSGGTDADDDTAPRPDGAPGMFPGSQPDPGKGQGGPPYLQEDSDDDVSLGTGPADGAEPTRPKRTATPAPKATPKASAAARPAPERSPSGAPTSSGGVSAQVTAAEDEVVRLTNLERQKAGCAPLRVDERLRQAARAHSDDMAAKGYFDHTSADGRSPWDRIKAAGYQQPGAENIARGQRTPAAVVEAWMNSPGHRANILNCRLKAIGVGVNLGAGGPWWTQDFGYA